MAGSGRIVGKVRFVYSYLAYKGLTCGFVDSVAHQAILRTCISNVL
ncbi:hypothetical protein SS322685_0183 [Shigella sonnei 3226-85]|nr:hypothetical protein SS53G_3491 [Shigella sonnei 53G]EIQ37828.1 hypothetical protein SS323385_5078 [Shigella sonnei 3233-85]EIQ48974.1 hypothetical protein SS322685_0183 [Shigella sonnei 3226-85]